MKRILLETAQSGLTKDGRRWVSPLDYFEVERRVHPGRPAQDVMQKRVEVRRAYGDSLKWEGFLSFLTTADKKTLPVAKRPENIQKTMEWGVAYIRSLYGKDISEETAEAWLRESFEELPWDMPDQPIRW
ncbi:hypothetical protein [Arenimonas alkanexedens]